MRCRELIVAAAIPVLLLVACGPKGNPDAQVPGAPTGTTGGASSTEAQGPADGSSTTTASAAAGPIDVCALLSDADAVDVATKAPLVNATSVKYTITKEKQTPSPEVVFPPLGDCKFYFYSETPEYPRSINATVQIQATDAKDFGLYKSGTPVPGLGDEAYKVTGSTVVRKGNVMLSAGENSATDDFVVAMYKKMVPHLP
jgi:hypothetical protein